MARTPVSLFSIRPLDDSTWPIFAELVERNNGIYGGCWCAPHHVEYERHVSDPQSLKRELVATGRALAALVVDADGFAQGWCQFGPADSLRLNHERAYRLDPPPPAAWRIACVFVDRRHRHQGIARIAVTGALERISRAGGGRVEVITEVTDGRAAQDRFLFSATAELFEELGFTRIRQVGKHAWILGSTVAPARLRATNPTSRAPRDQNPPISGE